MNDYAGAAPRSLGERMRHAAAKAILGEDMDKLSGEVQLWREAYAQRPWRFTADMIDPLTEYDPRLLDMIIRLRGGYEQLGGGSGNMVGQPDEHDRLLEVEQARYLYMYDVLTGYSIRLWTNFGFGQTVDIIPRDEAAVEVWDEFFTARRNRALLGERTIHKLSDMVLTDGELFLVFFVGIDGKTTMRRIPTEQIKQIVSDPNDAETPLWYKREYTPEEQPESGPVTIYYPDWAAAPDDLRRAKAKLPQDAVFADAEAQKTFTKVVVLHAAHNTIKRRGWPITVSAAPWSSEHKKFRENRAAVQRSRATFVDQLKVKGGKRGVDMVQNKLASTLATGGGNNLETNPAATAGSMLVTNEAVEVIRQNLSTGAADAKTDGEALSWLTLLGLGIFPHYAGMGDAYKLATATSMETPIKRQWQRYQLWWSDLWGDIAECVLRNYEEQRGQRNLFDTYEVDVNTDSLVQADLTQIKTLLDGIVSAVSSNNLDAMAGTLSVRKLLQLALQTMGIANVDDIIPNEPPPTMPMPGMMNPDGTPMQGVPIDQLPPDTILTPDLAELLRVLINGQKFAEAEANAEDYGQSIRAAVRGLWSGNLNEGQFVDSMFYAIRRNITAAWWQGAESVGIQPDELTADEQTALQDMIHNELIRVYQFAGDIIGSSQANGGQLTPLLERASLWTLRFTDAVNSARVAASNDPKLLWVYGDAKHCNTCLRLNGKVKRASTWRAAGYRPQRPPNPALECGGWRCQCQLLPSTEKMTPGPLPSW
jgi:hypothetical protein